jgi:hypothetical protein
MMTSVSIPVFAYTARNWSAEIASAGAHYRRLVQ